MNTTTNFPQAGAVDNVIFGGAGDLSFRKLLPALYMAHLHTRLEMNTRIIAVGRQKWTRDEYLAFIDKHSPAFIEESAFTAPDWRVFLNRLSYVSMDVTQADDYDKLKVLCPDPALRVFYLATEPGLFTQICARLSAAGLIDAQSRVVLEKPLGRDLASARAINMEVARYFDEQQIYRIDHYLGKETVQNLMVLRFGNAIFEPLWRAPYIKSVQITVAETVGVGSRAGFYDGAGALRDMVQNHLLQLLCIVAMEPPVSFEADRLRDERTKVLEAIRPMHPEEVLERTVRGQYAAGFSGSAQLRRADEQKLGFERSLDPLREQITKLQLELQAAQLGGAQYLEQLVAAAVDFEMFRPELTRALPESLLESELFGHEKGAFTGAQARTEGRFQQAEGGTLFLDEIGDMPVALQAVLLRLLDDWTVRPVGGIRTKVNVFLVSATNASLDTAIAEGRFRSDLLYRLNTLEVTLPRLRDRSDFDAIVHHLLGAIDPNCQITPATIAGLAARPWPGNIRELENCIKRAVIMADGSQISAQDIGLAVPAPNDADNSLDLRTIRDRAEKNAIIAAMGRVNGNIVKAAELLGVSRPTLYDLMHRLGLK